MWVFLNITRNFILILPTFILTFPFAWKFLFSDLLLFKRRTKGEIIFFKTKRVYDSTAYLIIHLSNHSHLLNGTNSI